jgi:hypothetical protein
MFSCVKEGPVGPAGPAGATGPAGPAGSAGAAGATGPAGAAGTANVIYSDWFEFAQSEWKDSTISNTGKVFRAIKNAPSFTSAYYGSALVISNMAYKPLTNQDFFTQLPASLYDFKQANDADLYINFLPLPGKFIYYYNNNGYTDIEGLSASNLKDYFFRYIIIPGAVKAGNVANTGYSVDDLKSMKGSDIEKIFKIPTSGSNLN